MPKPRSHPAELALAIDGSLLLNVTSLLDAATLARVLAALPNATHVFVGVGLDRTEARRVRRKLEDASAEAAALVFGAKQPAPKKRARTRAARRIR